jgi:protease PrsW
MMIEQESGEPRIDQGEVRATFEELAGIKRALGRSTYSALNALLPFSRNDHWEVSELRQRLGHHH